MRAKQELGDYRGGSAWFSVADVVDASHFGFCVFIQFDTLRMLNSWFSLIFTDVFCLCIKETFKCKRSIIL